ncbi:MAG: efflux RND transporter permease subunit [Hyphomicrobiaceae bacterium]
MTGTGDQRSGISALGTEALGLLAMRHVAIAIVTLLVVTAGLMASAVFWLGFNGDVSKLLASRAKPYQDFVRLQQEFRPFSYDEVLFVRGPSLATAAGFEELRSLHLELQLAAPVERVTSIFSLVERGDTPGTWQPALPSHIENESDLRQHVTALAASNVAATSLFSLERSAAILILAPRGDPEEGLLGFSRGDQREISEIVASYASDKLQVTSVGQPAIARELVSVIKREQVMLVSIGLIVCAVVALWLFRSVAAAIVCTIPTLFALIWYLGFIALTGSRIDLFTTIIPVLIVVLTYADTLHLFFHWRRMCAAGTPPREALELAVRTVAPACFLAAVTTAIAFTALLFAASDTLDRMAIGGMIGMVLVYISVITVTPLAAITLSKCGARFGSMQATLLQTGSSLGRAILDGRRGQAIALSGAATLVLIGLHMAVPVQFKLTDYLPRDSHLRHTSSAVDTTFNGAGQMFATLERDAGRSTISSAEFGELHKAEAVLQGVFGIGSTISIATVQGATPPDGPAPLDLSEQQTAAEGFLSRLVSRDRKKLLISIFVSHGSSAAELDRQIQNARQALAEHLPGRTIEITGGPALRTELLPKIVFDLRHGLLLSAVLSIFVIGFALGSWQLGIASLLPNALPVLAAEAGVWMMRDGLEMSTVIALTIGFGLAVDDTVHLLNHYVIEKRKSQAAGGDASMAMQTALKAVSPALVATTVVLCAALTVTALSSLTTVTYFGLVVISILVFALAADLLVLPSMAVQLEKLFRREHA